MQEAYASITRQRRRSPVPPPSEAPPPPSSPDVEERLANLERDLREKARAAREQAQRAARAAAAAATSKKQKPDRPSDEELGYIKTDDTFSKIVADGLDEFAEWIERRRKPD